MTPKLLGQPTPLVLSSFGGVEIAVNVFAITTLWILDFLALAHVRRITCVRLEVCPSFLPGGVGGNDDR